jgi:hypothetical protein
MAPASGWIERAEPHAPDTFEHLVVAKIPDRRAGGALVVLGRGDVLLLRADVARVKTPVRATPS